MIIMFTFLNVVVAIRMGRPKKLRLDDVRHTTTTGCPYVVPRVAVDGYNERYCAADKFNFPQPHCDNVEPLLGYNDLLYGYTEPRCGYTDHTSDDDSGFRFVTLIRRFFSPSHLGPLSQCLTTPHFIMKILLTNQRIEIYTQP